MGHYKAFIAWPFQRENTPLGRLREWGEDPSELEQTYPGDVVANVDGTGTKDAHPEFGRRLRMCGSTEYLRTQAVSRLMLDNIYSMTRRQKASFQSKVSPKERGRARKVKEKGKVRVKAVENVRQRHQSPAWPLHLHLCLRLHHLCQGLPLRRQHCHRHQHPLRRHQRCPLPRHRRRTQSLSLRSWDLRQRL